MNARSLGVIRALLLGFALVHYGPMEFRGWADVTAFWQPISLFRVFHLGVLSASALTALEWAWRVALAFTCVGLFTPIASLLAAAGGTYLLGLPNNFGKVHHFDAAFVIVLWIIALSRAGDAFSLDARRAKRPASAPEWEYRWPIAAMRAVVAFAFFAAGVSKLRHSGLAWVTSSNMSILLAEHARRQHANLPPLLPSLSLLLSRLPVAPNLLAGMTVGIELANPVALVSRRARWLVVPGTLLMLLGFRALLGPDFYALIALQCVWVDWDEMLRRRPVRLVDVRSEVGRQLTDARLQIRRRDHTKKSDVRHRKSDIRRHAVPPSPISPLLRVRHAPLSSASASRRPFP